MYTDVEFELRLCIYIYVSTFKYIYIYKYKDTCTCIYIYIHVHKLGDCMFFLAKFQLGWIHQRVNKDKQKTLYKGSAP